MSVSTVRPHAVPAAVPRRRSRRSAWSLLLAALLIAVALSLTVGTRPVPLSATWEVLPHVLTGDLGSAEGVATLDAAVVQSRAWRTVAGVLTGAALAVAGALLQGATRNPLGDPGILGLTAGAACAVVAGAVLGGLVSPESQLGLAAVGSAVAMMFVYGLAAAAKGGARPVTLALTGAAVSAGLGAVTSALLLTDQATFNSFRTWQVGDLARPDGTFLLMAAPVILAGILLAWPLGGSMDTLSLGDALGRGLGAHPTLIRVLAGGAVVLLAGTATALAGPLVFCGLLVPHAVRAFVGVSYRRVIPACVSAGPTIVLLADTLARIALPDRELQVGIALVIIGAPALVAVVRRKGVVTA